MKAACLVGVLSAVATLAFGGDRVPEPTAPDGSVAGLYSIIPRKFREGGAVYAFDESYLLEWFRYSLDRYEANKDEGENREDTKIRIAYCIISAGIFAQKSAELQELFDRARRLLGDQKVPNGVMSPITAAVACASVSFKKEDGDILDVDVAHLASDDFRDLLLISQLQLDARSAKTGALSDEGIIEQVGAIVNAPAFVFGRKEISKWQQAVLKDGKLVVTSDGLPAQATKAVDDCNKNLSGVSVVSHVPEGSPVIILPSPDWIAVVFLGPMNRDPEKYSYTAVAVFSVEGKYKFTVMPPG